MKYAIFLFVFFVIGCDEQNQSTEIETFEERWEQRAIDVPASDTLIHGKTYLSVYSQMYNFSQHQKFNLTGLISLRNVSDIDTIYLMRTDFYNTTGDMIRTYFDYPIYVKPMETLEIVISKRDIEGGTGSNFVFEWKIPLNCPEPLFEGVMNSIQGNQGLSFTTVGRRTE